METKRDKFVRLATARTNKIIEMISLLGNLGNKSNYDYSDVDVEKIFKSIETELKEARKKYSSDSMSNNGSKKFTL